MSGGAAPRTAAVLLAGGTGTRLYPASRPDRPKQFLALGGDRSLLRRTADRAGFADAQYVVTRERYADRVRELVPGATVLVEPGLDTGPALVYAAHRIRERARERGREPPVLCCLPTDHHVAGPFAATMRRAARAAAETGGLVCVGVEPDRPATGYGYVEPATPPGDGWAAIERFEEKPDSDRARALVDRGCLWNAGTFVWRPDAFLRAAAASPLAPLVDALDAGDPEAGFAAVEPTSVDYAVMERTDDAYVVAADFEWDDVGTWDAVGRVLDGEDGNAVAGEGGALALDAAGNVVYAADAHVSLLDVEGLVVAVADGRVLVADRDAADRVREVVDRLGADR